MKMRDRIEAAISNKEEGRGIEKNIYRDPGDADAFVGLFRNTRKVILEGDEIDAMRPFQETPNYIKAIFYVNQLAEILMPGLIRHIEQAGRILDKNGDDSIHIFSSRGFIEADQYKAVALEDDAHKRAKAYFAENGFYYDDKFPNIAIQGDKGGVVYTDTVSPWKYELRGIVYEHSRNGRGIGGVEYVYEPIPLFDDGKIEAAIQRLGDNKQKAQQHLSRLNSLFEDERAHWEKKKAMYANNDDSIYEKIDEQKS